ncbi:unnamed protein product [Tuber melanosporum]|uniref:(Perigord truffle) hypothetical protein n=1 Tax=Tuber melanosporum (strain Mel28) TaxID=656061 RepID=D5GGL8_TUBMM|nr:uncharacterized protein GSTUM_00007412001 [Tuber melanosporum]CAZ83640.1 unnamed protein product [Tuber melanosporum]
MLTNERIPVSYFVLLENLEPGSGKLCLSRTTNLLVNRLMRPALPVADPPATPHLPYQRDSKGKKRSVGA